MDIKSIESAKIKTDKPSVIITGVTGQDGSHFVDYLLKNTDFAIYGAARRLSVPNHQNLKHINDARFVLFNMDVTDPHSISKAITTFQPSYFINMAAQSFVGSSWDFPEQTWQTNCTAILHMLESIRQYKPDCRFYNAGSSEEFGDVTYSPQDENHPPRPRSPYGASKVAARQLVKVYRESFNLYAVQGWLFNHEGTRRGEEFVTRKITKAVDRIINDILHFKKPMPLELGNVNAKRDWGDAEDYVDAIWRMLNQEEYNHRVKFSLKNISRVDEGLPPDYSSFIKDYVVGTGKQHTIREFVEVAFETAIGQKCGYWSGTGENEKFVIKDCDGNLHDVVVINPTYYRPAEVNKLVADNKSIYNDLGWKPTTNFYDLVKKMVKNDRILLSFDEHENPPAAAGGE